MNPERVLVAAVAENTDVACLEVVCLFTMLRQHGGALRNAKGKVYL